MIGLLTYVSLLYGITNSFPILIIARVMQAIGAAVAIANNQGIIIVLFPQMKDEKHLDFQQLL